MNNIPAILHETEDFAIVFKPPRMHTAPIGQDAPPGRDSKESDGGGTLLDWYTKSFPPIMELSGRKEGEGGLLHRLDFETQGLVLFAKNQKALENLLIQQKQGTLIKEYSATCQKSDPQPGAVEFSIDQQGVNASAPLVIESYFRPYGPGRKLVRPVTEEKLKGKKIAKDAGAYYITEVIGVERKQIDNKEEVFHFTLRLKRGFRHQIRCHLAWVGFPVLHDPLYGKDDGEGFLALRATGLFFDDPKSNEPIQFRISVTT
jgi:23S rRNA pseudouridine1911/1915/1917 synthase